MRFTSVVLLTAFVLAPRARAVEVLIGDPYGEIRTAPGGHLYWLQTDDGSLFQELPTQWWAMYDLVVSRDGWLFAATETHLARYSLDWTVTEGWAPTEWSRDVAFESSGWLVALDWGDAPDVWQRLVLVREQGALEVIDEIDGVELRGSDVPRAGPLEDGIIAIGTERVIGRPYQLWRYPRRADGTWEREGPFELVALQVRGACAGIGPSALHPTARATGETFLVPEGCTNLIQEYDLDGNFLGTFADLESDPTVIDQWTGRVFYDWVQNLVVLPNDEVVVSMRRRVYHFDPNGNLIRKIDHVFDQANGLAVIDWVPFATAAETTCEPSGLGYWKRQCLSLPLHPRATPHAGGFPGLRPGDHPSLTAAERDALFTAVDDWLAPYGVTTCEALWPLLPDQPRARALAQLAALYLDLEAGRSHFRCEAVLRGQRSAVWQMLKEIRELLDAGTPDADRHAAWLATRASGARETP